MKRLVTISLPCTLLLAVAAFSPPAPSPQDAAGEVMRMECAWEKAYLNADITALTRIEADDFVETDDGETYGKQEDIDGVRSGRLRFSSTADGEMRVRVYGNAAVATGRAHVVGSMDGHPFDVVYAYTDTWIRRDGAWQAVAVHASHLGTAGTPAAPVQDQCATMS